MILDIIGWIGIVVFAASLVCACTPTPKDNNLLGKAYWVIEILALNIMKAKDQAKAKK